MLVSVIRGKKVYNQIQLDHGKLLFDLDIFSPLPIQHITSNGFHGINTQSIMTYIQMPVVAEAPRQQLLLRLSPVVQLNHQYWM